MTAASALVTPEIGVYSESTRPNPIDLAFWTAAVDQQLREHAAPLWGIKTIPVVFYDHVPQAGAWPMAIKDTVPDGELGDHGDFGNGPVATVLFDAGTPVTLSHEGLEMWRDPEVNLWKPYKNGSFVAVEIGDPVEAQTYVIPVTLLGETWNVPVSNFILPAYFDENSAGPWDYLKLLPGPLSIAPGGYLIILNADGTYSNIWGRNTSPAQMARAAAKFSAPHRRAYKRIHGRRPPTLLNADGTKTLIQLAA